MTFHYSIHVLTNTWISTVDYCQGLSNVNWQKTPSLVGVIFLLQLGDISVSDKENLEVRTAQWAQIHLFNIHLTLSANVVIPVR